MQSEPESTRLDESALTKILRASGAVLLVASASTFMLQQWQAGNDLLRYALLAGHTVLLAAAAYFCGWNVRESQGARTFLGLILGVIPIVFAVLGGLVYSQFHWEPLVNLPHYARWVAPSGGLALLCVFLTVLVLVPLATIAFVALARKDAKCLTLAFFGTNLLLLLPFRTPAIAAALFAASIVVLVQLELRRWSQIPQLSTIEGKIARLMPFIAPGLIVGRALHLYNPTRTFAGFVALSAAYVLYCLAPRTQNDSVRESYAIGSAVLGVLGWAALWADLRLHVASAGAAVVLLGLPCALIFALVSRRAVHASGLMSSIAVLIALGSALAAPIVELTTVTAIACLITGIGIAAWGALRRSLLLVVPGMLVGLLGIVLQVALAIRVDDLTRWGSLTLAGVLLIIGSSYVERHKGRLSAWWTEREDVR